MGSYRSFCSFKTISTFTLVLSISVSGTALASLSNYREVRDFMRKTVEKNPGNASSFILGTADSGETIEGLKIGDGPVHNLVVGTHHGNEYGSTEVAMGVAASLAENPIKGQTVYVIPVLNIVGYNSRTRWEVVDGKSIDPNRNYPGPCGTEGPFTLKSTQALAKFVENEHIVASATLHTFSPAVLYPWGISTEDLSTPYDDLFKQLGAAAAMESGYAVGNSTELLYAADGTYEDYAFWKHGIWSLLFELGDSHYPSESDIAHMVKVNVPGIRRMLELSPRERAEKHDFTGKCSRVAFSKRDRHDE